MIRPAPIHGVLLAAVLAAVPLTAESVVAQETPAQNRTDTRWGVGFQSAYPAYGLSGMYDVTDQFTAQAVIGALGEVTTLSGRVLYHLRRLEKYGWYAFGTAGMWRYSYDSFNPFTGARISDSETAVSFGGGAGAELNWANILSPDDESFPPIFSTIDLGLIMVSGFDVYNMSAFTWGVGLHYRF